MTTRAVRCAGLLRGCQPSSPMNVPQRLQAWQMKTSLGGLAPAPQRLAFCGRFEKGRKNPHKVRLNPRQVHASARARVRKRQMKKEAREVGPIFCNGLIAKANFLPACFSASLQRSATKAEAWACLDRSLVYSVEAAGRERSQANLPAPKAMGQVMHTPPRCVA